MGNFKIEIEAVGGHGVARDIKQGEAIPYEDETIVQQDSPDVMVYDFLAELHKAGNSVVSARLIHWPDTTPIIDNLLTSTREHGDFQEKWEGDKLLAYFQFSHLPEGPLRETSRLFCHMAYRIARTIPSSAERTVALRKLLEGKDAAVRAMLPVNR